MGTGIQGCKGTGSHGYKVTRLQGYWVARVQGYRDTGINRSEKSKRNDEIIEK